MKCADEIQLHVKKAQDLFFCKTGLKHSGLVLRSQGIARERYPLSVRSRFFATGRRRGRSRLAAITVPGAVSFEGRCRR